jgi:hypothetical protein
MISINGYISKDALFNNIVFYKLLQLALENLGFFRRITIHLIYQGLANKVNSKLISSQILSFITFALISYI